MITIIFESHSTTTDNEARLASGHNDVELSDAGLQQSKELGERRKGEHFDVIFCSDLQRSYKTAELAFGDKYLIIKDARLRECDYGDLTQKAKELIDAEKPGRINEPFPNGESYTQTCQRMHEFLQDLLRDYDGKTVMIIGHRATQYGLEHNIEGVSIEQAVTAPWQWQPGWEYHLESL
ncbi:MAG: histidine phosphatase family protein [Candidatus Saccharibacteria bacterium]|nr:histidine phosphatase family protein [Candidatus Saccharibacteria bacterium]